MTKNIYILFILLVLSSLCAGTAYSGDLCSNTSCIISFINYDLDGDVLYRLEGEGRTKLYDKVAAISKDNNTLYYIRSVHDRWIAGFFKGDALESEEFNLPGMYEKLYKFAGFNNVFYYLATPLRENADGQNVGDPVYTRFNPDQWSLQSIEGVSDFILMGGKSVILKNQIIDYNGFEIPLLITGNLRIAELLDSRIAVIRGDGGAEIVDLIAGRNIYQYNEDFIPEIPDEYNVIIEFVDKPAIPSGESGIGESIYYEILVDGVEDNRTVTGNGELIKVFQSKLVPGRFHIIKPERWELDKLKGRYGRMNNISQPAELKIYIPENRILKVRVEFDGTEYRVNQSVLFK